MKRDGFVREEGKERCKRWLDWQRQGSAKMNRCGKLRRTWGGRCEGYLSRKGEVCVFKSECSSCVCSIVALVLKEIFSKRSTDVN